jgi:hypothetical protein
VRLVAWLQGAWVLKIICAVLFMVMHKRRLSHLRRAQLELQQQLFAAGTGKSTPPSVMEALPVLKYAQVAASAANRRMDIAIAISGHNGCDVGPAGPAEKQEEQQAQEPAPASQQLPRGPQQEEQQQEAQQQQPPQPQEEREEAAHHPGCKPSQPQQQQQQQEGAECDDRAAAHDQGAGAAAPAPAPAPAAASPPHSSSAAEACAICFEEFGDEDDVKQLPCNHIYHPHCIDEWWVLRGAREGGLTLHTCSLALATGTAVAAGCARRGLDRHRPCVSAWLGRAGGWPCCTAMHPSTTTYPCPPRRAMHPVASRWGRADSKHPPPPPRPLRRRRLFRDITCPLCKQPVCELPLEPEPAAPAAQGDPEAVVFSVAPLPLLAGGGAGEGAAAQQQAPREGVNPFQPPGAAAPPRLQQQERQEQQQRAHAVVYSPFIGFGGFLSGSPAQPRRGPQPAAAPADNNV